jgi:drug/metabolite transporter (DMT)-like permease
VVDVIVVLVALPSLTILALLLEANTRGNWLETSRSRYTVFGLGLTLTAICLALFAYLTSRIGGKMWSGAIPSESGNPAFSYYVSSVLIKQTSRQTRDLRCLRVFDCKLDKELRD